MTITVTPEELEEFPEPELPEVDFDAEKLVLMLEVISETKEALALQPFNAAASMSVAKMAKDLKEEVDKAQEDYRKACEEREAKILEARRKKAEEEAKEQEKEDA